MFSVFSKIGGGRGAFHTAVRGTMFVRNGAVTPRPSSECDITFFVKGLPKSAQQSHDSTVAARGGQSVTVPSSWVTRKCRSPGLSSPPPIKSARIFGAQPGVVFYVETFLYFWDSVVFGLCARPAGLQC